MGMDAFSYSSNPQRVTFGSGSISRLSEEVARLKKTRVVVLCTPGQREQAKKVTEGLEDLRVGIFDGAQMHVPVDSVSTALKYIHTKKADCLVAFGGGSTIGLGKALALKDHLPVIAVPTTYAGSEMTPIYGVTENGIKVTGRDPRVLPVCVLYDPVLSSGLPPDISIASGMNAMAHAAEALYANDRNPVASIMAIEGIRALARGLPAIRGDSEDRAARESCLYGAWLCGSVLGQVSMGLHHKLCHTLGGTLDLPHAETHTAILPHALAYNTSAAPVAMNQIADALGTEDAARGMHEFAASLGMVVALRDLGMEENQIELIADIVTKSPYQNPAPIQRNEIVNLLRRAWAGEPPRCRLE